MCGVTGSGEEQDQQRAHACYKYLPHDILLPNSIGQTVVAAHYYDSDRLRSGRGPPPKGALPSLTSFPIGITHLGPFCLTVMCSNHRNSSYCPISELNIIPQDHPVKKKMASKRIFFLAGWKMLIDKEIADSRRDVFRPNFQLIGGRKGPPGVIFSPVRACGRWSVRRYRGPWRPPACFPGSV